MNGLPRRQVEDDAPARRRLSPAVAAVCAGLGALTVGLVASGSWFDSVLFGLGFGSVAGFAARRSTKAS